MAKMNLSEISIDAASVKNFGINQLIHAYVSSDRDFSWSGNYVKFTNLIIDGANIGGLVLSFGSVNNPGPNSYTIQYGAQIFIGFRTNYILARATMATQELQWGPWRSLTYTDVTVTD